MVAGAGFGTGAAAAPCGIVSLPARQAVTKARLVWPEALDRGLVRHVIRVALGCGLSHACRWRLPVGRGGSGHWRGLRRSRGTRRAAHAGGLQICAALREELRPSLTIGRPRRFGGLPLIAALFHYALDVGESSSEPDCQRDHRRDSEGRERLEHVILPPRNRTAKVAGGYFLRQTSSGLTRRSSLERRLLRQSCPAYRAAFLRSLPVVYGLMSFIAFAGFAIWLFLGNKWFQNQLLRWKASYEDKFR